jgi:hypothetical protein
MSATTIVDRIERLEGSEDGLLKKLKNSDKVFFKRSKTFMIYLVFSTLVIFYIAWYSPHHFMMIFIIFIIIYFFDKRRFKKLSNKLFSLWMWPFAKCYLKTKSCSIYRDI